MIRDVDLTRRLPPFLAKYKELIAVLQAENPEFTLVWQEADKVLNNNFIDTADEDGITRFENILNLAHLNSESLEVRRAKIKMKWLNNGIYNLKYIKETLSVYSDVIYCKIKDYSLSIEFNCENESIVSDVFNTILKLVPASIEVILFFSTQGTFEFGENEDDYDINAGFGSLTDETIGGYLGKLIVRKG